MSEQVSMVIDERFDHTVGIIRWQDADRCGDDTSLRDGRCQESTRRGDERRRAQDAIPLD
jgi:hypothetical protein